MRTIFEWITVALVAGLGCGVGVAQQGPPKIGFLRIVNAIAAGEGRASFKVDGEDLFPKGYELGQRTGGLGMRAGSYEIEVRKSGVGAGTTRVSLAAGETLTLIAFAERLPAENENEPPRWTTKILRLKQSDPEKGYLMTVVSVCERPEVRIQAAVQSKGAIESVTVRRLALTRVNLGHARGEVLVRADEEVITTVSPDSPGNYVVLLYEDDAGVIRALTFFDPKFVLAG